MFDAARHKTHYDPELIMKAIEKEESWRSIYQMRYMRLWNMYWEAEINKLINESYNYDQFKKSQKRIFGRGAKLKDKRWTELFEEEYVKRNEDYRSI
jgi:hypothetical protein